MNPKKMNSGTLVAVKPRKTATTGDMVNAAWAAIDLAIQGLARFMGGTLPVRVLAVSYERTCEFLAALEDLKKLGRDAIITMVERDGKVTTEKGSMQLVRDGWQFEIRPHKTGYDPKKVEAHIRSIGRNPNEFMDATVVYSVNEDKLVLAEFTDEELLAMRYEKSWSLQRPKQVE